ncbi:MAG: CHRD domain-containing protein [Acidobacteriota bacterium]
MSAARRSSKSSLWAILSAVVLLCPASALSDEVRVTLRGDNEIPPVTTTASGIGILVVGADKSVSGSVTISGMTVTVAHIHDASAGKNGPIIVPLTMTSDTVWTVPAGVKFTDAQYESYKTGNLYFNVHSATYKGGEIRGQIKP